LKAGISSQDKVEVYSLLIFTSFVFCKKWWIVAMSCVYTIYGNVCQSKDFTLQCVPLNHMKYSTLTCRVIRLRFCSTSGTVLWCHTFICTLGWLLSITVQKTAFHT